MKKSSLMIFAGCFVMVQFAGGLAFGKDTACKVVTVEGRQMVLDCGSEAGNYQVGQPVTVKPAKKRKTIEGC